MQFLFMLFVVVLSCIPLIRTILKKRKGDDVSNSNFLRNVLYIICGFAFYFIIDKVFSLWVELMWFQELGFPERFWTEFWSKLAYFFIGFAASAIFLCVNIRITKNKSLIEIPWMYPLAYFVAIAVSLVAGIISENYWESFLLYWNQLPFETADPIFKNDLSFYVFSLPVFVVAKNLLFGIVSIAILGVIAIYEIQYRIHSMGYDERRFGDRSERSRGTQDQREKIRFHQVSHLSVLGIFLMFVLIAWIMVSRWNILYSTRGAVFGAGWTDVNVQLPAYLAFIVVAVLCIVVLAISAGAQSYRMTKIWAITGFGACGLTIMIGVWLVPTAIQYLYVSSNEIAKEEEYIKHDIEFTRKAYGLTEKNIQTVNFPVNMNVDSSLLTDNKETLNTVRLWDFRVLQSNYSQMQVFRTYYTFPDVDVVRYKLGDQLVQLMCSAREMDHERLPNQSKTWQNTHLFYTHGFGLVANPANIFLPPEGMPDYWIKDVPPKAKFPELEITQPRIYFGERTTSHVYVKAKEPEFDYPQGEHNVTYHYEGTGGFPVGTGLRKLAIAWEFDGLRLLTSDEIIPESRLMFNRSIENRVKTIAPFLLYDGDPYQVIADGQIWYIWDAYTTTDMYPYSTTVKLDANSVLNYIRNSVKVTINAYSGKVDFYVFDEKDPIVKAYKKIFPSLFKPSSAMPKTLQQHVRYPEDLLKVQGYIYSRYHMGDPKVFYNKEDAWEIAREISGNNKANFVLPYYVIMKIPGEKKEEFTLIYPFTPYSNDPVKHQRPNMVAWLAGRCDGENYGKLLVYLFPKDRFINGPQQIGIRINQDEVISKDFSLWNQQGSQVVLGNLLVLPLSDYRLMYVQPIYIQADQGKMPELKRVVVASGDKLAYGTSFEDALKKLIGGATLQKIEAPQETAKEGAKEKTQNDLIREAAERFDRYREFTGQGKFSEAGKEMDQLGKILNSLVGQ